MEKKLPKRFEPGEFIEWLDMPSMKDQDEVMAFDKRMCQEGHKRFMRRLSDAERKEAPEDLDANAVIVQEITPGVRFREFVIGEQLTGKN